jgi:hypothetical protein
LRIRQRSIFTSEGDKIDGRLTSHLSFFFENHEKRRKGKRKEDPEKKKAFAFFCIEITVSFSSLFSFVLRALLDHLFIFTAGLVAR